MRINRDSLKARANNIARQLGISQNAVYNRFFFDAFLTRLASSPYRDKLILKGGLYLSSVLGIDTRATMDVDFYVKKVSMEEERVVSVVKEISAIDVEDGVSFEVIGSNSIRENDVYGGFQVTLFARLDNVRYQFGIDIATGDPIVPSERNYDYQCLVSGETLSIKAYSLESVIAEKLETILSRGIVNSRSKDYYDLYILRKTQRINVSPDVLKQAYRETCRYRSFSIPKEDALILIDEIEANPQINQRWINYGRIVGYAEDVGFPSVIDAIKEWIDIAL